jgi:hypothetical protein
VNIPLAINPAAERVIQGELEDGERLLWAGRPRQGLQLRREIASLIAFALASLPFIGAFAVGPAGAQTADTLLGNPFVLWMVFVAVAPIVLDALVRRRTAYGLTDRRAIFVSQPLGRQVTAMPLTTLPELTLTEDRDGSGTIWFGPPRRRGMGGTQAFNQIAGVRQVYALIQDAPADPRVRRNEISALWRSAETMQEAFPPMPGQRAGALDSLPAIHPQAAPTAGPNWSYPVSAAHQQGRGCLGWGAVLALIVFGCAGLGAGGTMISAWGSFAGETRPHAAATPTAPRDTPDNPAGPGVTLTGNGLEVTLLAGETSLTADGFSDAPSGFQYLILDAAIHNVGDEVKSYAVRAWSATDVDRGDTHASLTAATDQDLGTGTLAPGDTVRGHVVLMVPSTLEARLLIDYATTAGERLSWGSRLARPVRHYPGRIGR